MVRDLPNYAKFGQALFTLHVFKFKSCVRNVREIIHTEVLQHRLLCFPKLPGVLTVFQRVHV